MYTNILYTDLTYAPDIGHNMGNNLTDMQQMMNLRQDMVNNLTDMQQMMSLRQEGKLHE